MTTPDLISKLREAWVGTDDYTSILIMLAADRLEELSGWIDFNERYPELGQEVICQDSIGYHAVAYRTEAKTKTGLMDGMVTDNRGSAPFVKWRAI